MEDFDKIKGNPNFTVIGHMVAATEGNHLITRANTKIELKSLEVGMLLSDFTKEKC